MKINAKKNTMKDFSPLVLPIDVVGSMDPQNDEHYIVAVNSYYNGIQKDLFSITVGNDYSVYAIMTLQNQIYYLISDDDGYAQFYPAELFEIKNNYLSFDWCFHMYSILEASGYKEARLFLFAPDFIQSYRDLISLIQSDPVIVRKFLDYKAGML